MMLKKEEERFIAAQAAIGRWPDMKRLEQTHE
jgi:hypothetical protein